MAAVGPDFKSRFVDPAPASNADIGRTVADLLGLRIQPKGRLVGRVLTEALRGGRVPTHGTRILRSATSSTGGHRTVLRYQLVGQTRYFDAAGFAGRTVGLDSDRR
jgi:hypothetical protein